MKNVELKNRAGTSILAVEIIMIIAKIGINVLVGMLAHGGVQQKLAMLIIKGIGAIGEFGSLIKSSNKALKKYTKMALRIKEKTKSRPYSS